MKERQNNPTNLLYKLWEELKSKDKNTKQTWKELYNSVPNDDEPKNIFKEEVRVEAHPQYKGQPIE